MDNERPVEIVVESEVWGPVLAYMKKEAETDPETRKLYAILMGSLIESQHPLVRNDDRTVGE